MTRARRLATLAAVMAILTGACGAAATPAPSAAPPSAEASAATASAGPSEAAAASPAPSIDTTPVTITVWDYYGESTPVKPALAGFQKEYPWITVDYQALDWDSMNEKFTVGVSSGEAPDVATLDMTWIPTLAANGALEDLSTMSGGQLNGKPIADQYTKGALDAMTFDGQVRDDAASTSTRTRCTTARTSSPRRGSPCRPPGMSSAPPPSSLPRARRGVASRTATCMPSGRTRSTSRSSCSRTAARFSTPTTRKPPSTPTRVSPQSDIQKAMLDDGSGLYWPDANNDLLPAITSGQVAMFSGRPVLHGPPEDRRPRSVRRVEDRDRPVLQAARELPGRNGPRDSGRREAQGRRLAVHPVHAPAGAAGRRVHLRGSRPGHHGGAPEPGADETRPVLRRPGSRSRSSSTRWPRRRISRTWGPGRRSTR